MRSIFIIGIFIASLHFHQVDSLRDSCGPGINECDIGNWLGWESCSERCGGGIQIRRKPICCDVNLKTLEKCLTKCNVTEDEFNNKTTESRPCNQRCYNTGQFNVSTSVCDCVNGSWGKCCEQQINECQSNPCGKNGYCYDRFLSFQCNCYRGYYGKQCEHHYCDTKTCENNATCEITRTIENRRYVYKASCRCKPGFYGEDCQYVNPCASNPCNEGRCVPDKTNFTCDCRPCYNGEYCELPNNNTCENNSTCYGRKNRNVYIQACRCKPGFHGDRCQYVDQCQSGPCNQGQCSPKENTFTCDCQQCFGGMYCELNNNTCENNSTCYSKRVYLNRRYVNVAACRCPAGFHGDSCQFVDACRSNPCNNGKCIPINNTFTCECDPCSTGKNCELSVCQNNSTCNKQQTMYYGRQITTVQCQCSPGFYGDKCQNWDPCSSSPCVNGTCVRLNQTFSCSCDPCIMGKYCDIDFCSTTFRPLTTSRTMSTSFKTMQGTTLLTSTTSPAPILSSIPMTTTTLFSPLSKTSLVVSTTTAPSSKSLTTVTTTPTTTAPRSKPITTVTTSTTTRAPGSKPLTKVTTSRASTVLPMQTKSLTTPKTSGSSTTSFPASEIKTSERKAYTNIHPQTKTGCVRSQCKQGSCVEVGYTYWCYCEPGYTGINCHIDKDDCQNDPCIYGKCIDEVNAFHCECNALFTGKTCAKMRLWAIISISLGSFIALMLCCCCAGCIPSYCKKKDDDKMIIHEKPRPLPIKKPIHAWVK